MLDQSCIVRIFQGKRHLYNCLYCGLDCLQDCSSGNVCSIWVCQCFCVAGFKSFLEIVPFYPVQGKVFFSERYYEWPELIHSSKGDASSILSSARGHLRVVSSTVNPAKFAPQPLKRSKFSVIPFVFKKFLNMESIERLIIMLIQGQTVVECKLRKKVRVKEPLQHFSGIGFHLWSEFLAPRQTFIVPRRTMTQSQVS